jgi:hypothetical protein
VQALVTGVLSIRCAVGAMIGLQIVRLSVQSGATGLKPAFIVRQPRMFKCTAAPAYVHLHRHILCAEATFLTAMICMCGVSTTRR